MKEKFWRWGVYLCGLLTLAVGITLNTKTGLGVSPLISLPFVASHIWGLSLGNTTLISYVVFILLQIVLNGKGSRLRTLLQLPLSLVFTRLMDLISPFVPMQTQLTGQAAMLVIAILLTGIGAAMSLDMRLIPNPSDGVVQSISDFLHKETGLCKNCIDAVCTLLAVALSLAVCGKIIGIGVGTVATVLGIGRIIALFNRLFLKKLQSLAGLQEQEKKP